MKLVKQYVLKVYYEISETIRIESVLSISEAIRIESVL